MPRGRPRKEADPLLKESVGKLREALECEDSSAIAAILISLKNSKPEAYFSENLDQILDPSLRLQAIPQDLKQHDGDIEMVSDYYTRHPQLFGFKDFAEYEYLSWLLDCPEGDILDHSKSLGFDSENMYALVCSLRRKFLHKSDSVRAFSICLMGIPRLEDISDIVHEQEIDQQSSLGENMSKRLRKLARKEL